MEHNIKGMLGKHFLPLQVCSEITCAEIYFWGCSSLCHTISQTAPVQNNFLHLKNVELHSVGRGRSLFLSSVIDLLVPSFFCSLPQQ